MKKYLKFEDRPEHEREYFRGEIFWGIIGLVLVAVAYILYRLFS